MSLPGALWAALDYRAITGLKAVLAAGGALVLTWELLSKQGKSPEQYRSVRASLLIVLAAASFASWWNFGHFSFPEYLQIHEHYHYYLGSKYFHELQYTRLYECAAAAEVEEGFGREVAGRWMRNLETNVLEKGDRIARDPSICTSHFTPERWASFKHDVDWFRSHRTPENWRLSQIDHGYNATPVWGIAGQLLAETAPASTMQITLLGLIDPVLLLVAWAFVWWAFGWRTLCVALIWWGTNYPGRYIWTGGAFLRADWLALTVIGICLVKRGWMASGGFALTYAALLRIFPGFIIVALVLKAGATMVRRRSLVLDVAHKRFAAGSLAAGVLLLVLSAVVVGHGFAGGIEAWTGFVANSEKHLSTPLTNNMGLRTVVAYGFDTRIATVAEYYLDTPFDTWQAARRRLFAERAPVFWLLVGGFVVLLARAVIDQEDSAALALGVGLIPIAAELTCYYYVVLVLLGFLYGRAAWTGIALCTLSSLSCLLPAAFAQEDDLYMTMSILVIIVVVAFTATTMSQTIARGSSEHRSVAT